MAFPLQPHEGHLLRIFLVLVSFMLAPASPAAVEPHVRIFSIEEPESPRKAPSSFMDFPSQHHERDGSCPISGENWCGNDLPGDFCCSSESFCKVLAANTTALCCPKNSKGKCEVIMPITCSVRNQNPSTNPQAQVKTLALDQKLKRCGSKSGTRRCCPFGYSCRGDKECVLDEDQNESYAFLLPVPQYTTTSSSSAATSTAASSVTSDVLSVETSEAPNRIIQPPSAVPAASTTGSTPDDDDEEKEEKSSGISPTGAVTAGTVAGFCCLAGIGLFVWMKWFRKKRVQDTPDSNMSLARESWGYFSTQSPLSTRHVHLARGPDDKFIITPTTAGFTSQMPPLDPIVEEERHSPVELPATPVSLCMWSNLEDAAVEEPKLAYVIPAKQPR
ncbi:hypothetical protein HG530_008948 [Fusarium avenaceum]|nr:hypothetical protein HG530_008948 [Fusarium avenaceum]